ncbi:MAG: ketopantoate reductase family protein [Caldisericaceae bacterium]
MRKKFLVVGAGGRTGILFTEELQRAAEVVGVGREAMVSRVADGRILVSIDGQKPTKPNFRIISETKLGTDIEASFILLATKNPVGEAIRHYYQSINITHIPDLILPQNGLSAAEEAYTVLNEILGSKVSKMRIIRVALFNAVSSATVDNMSIISYSHPIRLSLGVAYGDDNVSDLAEILSSAGVEAYPVSKAHTKDMEYSKLFTNLIGVASFANGKSIEEGLIDDKCFYDEVSTLKEYVAVVKKNRGSFLNFKHYPIATLAFIVETVPFAVLRLFKGIIAKIILKGRGGKQKGNIDEIDYYNGAVIALAKKVGVETPVNSKIYKMIKEKV